MKSEVCVFLRVWLPRCSSIRRAASPEMEGQYLSWDVFDPMVDRHSLAVCQVLVSAKDCVEQDDAEALVELLSLSQELLQLPQVDLEAGQQYLLAFKDALAAGEVTCSSFTPTLTSVVNYIGSSTTCVRRRVWLSSSSLSHACVVGLDARTDPRPGLRREC